jgi:hypothetical protein
MELKDQKIITLAQVNKISDDHIVLTSWLNNNYCHLMGDLAQEWNEFRSALSALGALIQEKKDTLLWLGGDNSGIPSAKNLYSSLISARGILKVDFWKQKLWKWKIQLKVKLFAWLALEGKILTWDILQKRGWTGTGCCLLCKADNKSIKYIFITCSFVISVWNALYQELRLNRSWTGVTLADCMKSWIKDKSVPTYVAAFFYLVYLAREE